MPERDEASGGEILSGIDTVLVTGASGFVGQHLCERLEALGKTVIRTSRRTGLDLTKDQLPLKGVGHVFHAGARTGVPSAWDDPTGFIETNTLGTIRVLDQCRSYNCGVSFLSAYIYGNPQRIPIRETDSINTNNPYALSKHLAEQACCFFAKNYGVNVVSLRLFNVYGPGQSPNFLIPFIIEQAVSPAYDKIEVMDLHPSRDYIYIDDVIEAILRSTRASSGSIFNVGSGDAYSVEDVIKLICKAAGVNKPYFGKAQRRQNEIDLTKADISAIYDAVGWKPQTSLAAGLQKMVKCRARS
ncbi:nucleoside-diphosphate-sugar epimerase [Bradyrhizobium sp. USDA 4532]|uniref:NAD-dependent epimerase/dehydratase family protein n=1 Tax=unclassified Bradyrhizobium TaxID=2631580 RepID=UPI00209FD154|nr:MULTISPECIES: NAD-dependent epimerase/dehydratase family protein [unclassified Bradyrhizobium]MCP1831723.1 nucleoside-diphosphate-sugar epimerase [Bradyrhizobium sp. USDA 4545]MCP1916559.1 nucleoside-diphosphate-sugar epimerase [Bradyrhizobium sp. USDA 4532]